MLKTVDGQSRILAFDSKTGGNARTVDDIHSHKIAAVITDCAVKITHIEKTIGLDTIGHGVFNRFALEHRNVTTARTVKFDTGIKITLFVFATILIINLISIKNRIV